MLEYMPKMREMVDADAALFSTPNFALRIVAGEVATALLVTEPEDAATQNSRFLGVEGEWGGAPGPC